MPSPILHQGAIVTCSHGGTAVPTAPFARVLIAGQPVVTQGAPWLVTGCSLPHDGDGPCVSATFITAARRVFAGGVPPLLMESTGIAPPGGAPLIPIHAQGPVVGS